MILQASSFITNLQIGFSLYLFYYCLASHKMWWKILEWEDLEICEVSRLLYGRQLFYIWLHMIRYNINSFIQCVIGNWDFLITSYSLDYNNYLKLHILKRGLYIGYSLSIYYKHGTCTSRALEKQCILQTIPGHDRVLGPEKGYFHS